MTMYLDFYEQTFEAAKGFDDDFDFCPSLSPTELREMHKSRRVTSIGTNAGWRPTHHHHHYHHTQDKKRIPSSSLSYASYPYSASSASSSSGSSSPTLSSSPSASPPLSPSAAAMSTPTSRAIAIVDPVSRAPVQLPPSSNLVGVPSSATATTASGTAVGGEEFFSGIALPPLFHEPALTIETSSMMHLPSSPTSSSDDLDTTAVGFDGGLSGFWMDPTAAQYLPYPHHHLASLHMSQDFGPFAPQTYPMHHHLMGGPNSGYVAVPMMMMDF